MVRSALGPLGGVVEPPNNKPQEQPTIMDTVSSGRILFGAFELDLSTGELRSIEAPDPSKVVLREQVFQVLRLLLEREGKIVTREEIKSRLWSNDTIVDFDHSINATIKTLRRALGDSADNPRYVETLARRGYRLMPAVEYLEAVPETGLVEVMAKAHPARGRRRLAWVTGVLIAISALGVW